jgi:hypothetical protein
MLIMLVFDPLAVLLLIAANMSMKETKEDLPTKEIDVIIKPSYEPDTSPITEQQIEQIKETVATETTVHFEGVRTPGQDWIQTGPSFEVTTPTYPNISNEHEQVEIHHEPGVYEEHKVPVKKLEPKYDYDDPYAFREKGK